MKHLAVGSMRGQPACMPTGEAAGAADALSVRLGVTPRNLDVKMLQSRLLDQGVFLFDEEEKEKEQGIHAYSPTPPEDTLITRQT